MEEKKGQSNAICKLTNEGVHVAGVGLQGGRVGHGRRRRPEIDRARVQVEQVGAFARRIVTTTDLGYRYVERATVTCVF